MMHREPGNLRRLACAILALTALLVTPVAMAEEDPDYPHGEFEDDCSLCHGDDGWVPAQISPQFDHAERGFALRQSHTRAECRHCHSTLEFQLAVPECVSCHEDVHRGELGPTTRAACPKSVISTRAESGSNQIARGLRRPWIIERP